jgi:hypothetical protein
MTVYMWLALRAATVPISLFPPSIPLISPRWLTTTIPSWSRRIIVRPPLRRSTRARGAGLLLSTGALSKLWHAVAGLYLYVFLPLVPFAHVAYRIIRRFISSWEFVTTLDYEWSVFRRHRPFRWTIWVGSNARFLLVGLPCPALSILLI